MCGTMISEKNKTVIKVIGDVIRNMYCCSMKLYCRIVRWDFGAFKRQKKAYMVLLDGICVFKILAVFYFMFIIIVLWETAILWIFLYYLCYFIGYHICQKPKNLPYFFILLMLISLYSSHHTNKTISTVEQFTGSCF